MRHIKNGVRVKSNLDKRLDSIKKQKELEYGSFDSNMILIAKVWSVLLSNNLKQDILPHQVCQMFVASKLVRASNNYKDDTYIDAQSYLEQAKDMHEQNELDQFKKRLP